MVLLPPKLICTESGQTLGVASFQPPLTPQLAPVRTLSMIADTGKPVLKVLDAPATAPLLASATLMLAVALTTCDSAAVLHAAVLLLPLPASATALQPLIEFAPSLKLTLPVGLLPVTVAVNVTLVPTVDGFFEL